MKKLFLFVLLSPIMMQSQNLEKDLQQTLPSPIEDFVNSFYASHTDVEKMETFFDEAYFATFHRFAEHMALKNKDYGAFVNMKILKARHSPDSNMIWHTYKIKYKKGSMIEKLEFRRVSPSDPYQIFYWQTHR